MARNKRPRLKWTREAEVWLAEIHRFIAADDPVAAMRTVQGIVRRAQVLVHFPRAGRRYLGVSREVRILLYRDYRIAYVVTSAGDVDILGVFHGALDLGRFEL